MRDKTERNLEESLNEGAKTLRDAITQHIGVAEKVRGIGAFTNDSAVERQRAWLKDFGHRRNGYSLPGQPESLKRYELSQEEEDTYFFSINGSSLRVLGPVDALLNKDESQEFYVNSERHDDKNVVTVGQDKFHPNYVGVRE